MLLWNKESEVEFFTNSLKVTTPEQLFYRTAEEKYLAYYHKNYKGKKDTIQSRNSFIGKFTEKWSLNILEGFAKENNLFVVQDVVCEEIELKKRSPADLALCKRNTRIQKAKDIVLILEVKMSVVWNWEFIKKNGGELKCIGDYTTHSGNPGLLRSDSMLKAIGKSINIRISSHEAFKIPIVILGNTPISHSYFSKVDQLKKFGIIQGFWSLNPKPKDEDVNSTLKNTDKYGFIRMDSYDEFIKNLKELSLEEREYFSGMRTKNELGKIIEIANREDAYELKAEKFLSLLREI